MKKKYTFNLKKHMKQALYEGAQQQMRSERKKMDSLKQYLDKGMSQQEAWDKWLKEYDSDAG
jgi:hypothetical protein